MGVPYRLTGTLTGADGEPLPSMPVTISVDGQPEATLQTDAQGGFAWETVFNEATEATVDISSPGNAELGPTQTRWPVTAATPEIELEPPEPVAGAMPSCCGEQYPSEAGPYRTPLLPSAGSNWVSPMPTAPSRCPSMCRGIAHWG